MGHLMRRSNYRIQEKKKLDVETEKLSELSVHLGSIVLDSAALTKARFDFSKCNDTSALLLDKVKLMADSKLNKQYPLVDFCKLYNI